MFCNERIYLSNTNGMAHSHCRLQLGHPGPHSLLAKQDYRCPAVREGSRCGLPIGHDGQHTVTVGVKVEKSWS